MSSRKINQITALLLLVGFGGAFLIYLTALPDFVDPLLGDPMQSKKYVHEMTVIGGKANLVVAEFMDWFAGLWRGRTLARTVAVLTVAAVVVFRFFASLPPASAPEPGEVKTTTPGSV